MSFVLAADRNAGAGPDRHKYGEHAVDVGETATESTTSPVIRNSRPSRICTPRRTPQNLISTGEIASAEVPNKASESDERPDDD
jgi:hypothetical protein